MKKIELEITDINPSGSSTGAYALVLSEKKGTRKLPIVIGSHEAQAIAIEMENMKPGRPLTHDLFKTFAEAYNVTVSEVIIYNLVEGIFFARLVTAQNGKKIEIDARTSDAVALAVRFKCPIFCASDILDQAGIKIEDIESEEEEIMTGLEDEQQEEPVSLEELETQLNQALTEEDYEQASYLRDEINKRKAN